MTLTSQDLSDAVKYVCQFMHLPTVRDYRAVKRMLCHLSGTISQGMRILHQSSLNLYAYSLPKKKKTCMLTRMPIAHQA